MGNRHWWQGIATAVGLSAAPPRASGDSSAIRGELFRRLRLFLGAYHEVHGAESRGARAELEQLKGLLSDAAARLTASFEQMSALASRQQEIALGIARASHPGTCGCAAAAANDSDGADDGGEAIRISLPATQAPSAAGDLDAVTEDIERTANEAITALQFQDIASQLVGHTAERLDVLDRMAGELVRLPEATVDEMGEALAAARGARRSNSVSQRNLGDGGAELF